jgi:3-deoxy-7-phosphoheptulonate synthase
MPATSDLRIRASKPLIAPAVLAEELPLDEAAARVVVEGRRRIEAILAGEDRRLLAVVGPCSIHDPDAAVEYACRLADFAPRVADDLVLVMRVYFEKPRTILGWKGLINDPDLDGSYRINRGLRLAREVLLNVLRAGVPAATEFLDTILGQYYADLISWGAIGARTVESQVHRELASGLSMPVGFKNRTDGDVRVAVDAILSARHPHWFPSLTREGAPAVMGTAGNRFCHLVLRGGSSGPNFDAASIAAAVDRLRQNDLPPRLMVDCSHANSGKDASRQPAVAADLGRQIAGGSESIAAVMVESQLVAGSQSPESRPLVRGQSITDACLGWDETHRLLEDLAVAVARRRAG